MKKTGTHYTIVILALSLAFALFMNTPPAHASKATNAESTPIAGYWLTQNKRSVIEIEPCAQGLCGYIYWIIDGGMQYDSKNPDTAQRDKPMCGLPILWGFEKQETGYWDNGRIYKADDGDIYSAYLNLQKDGTLKVRGYMGFSMLGKTQIWNRVKKTDYKRCTAPQ